MPHELNPIVCRVLEGASIPRNSVEGLQEIWQRGSDAEASAPTLGFLEWLEAVHVVDETGRKAIEYHAQGYVDAETASACVRLDRVLELVGGEATHRPNTVMNVESIDVDKVLEPGEHVLGVRILEEIEYGAHGKVRLAFDASRDRFVVFKALEESARTWIETHARVLATGESKALPELLAAGSDPFPYAIFDWRTGVSLESFVGRFGSLRAPAALHIAMEAAGVLGELSTTGHHHGGFCARNIHISAGSRLSILDWGLSGAPSAYRAPELQGLDVTNASEVYAVGVLLVRLLTGFQPRRPRAAHESLELIESLRRGGHSASVVRILEGCLAHDPAHRFSCHAELVVELGRVIRDPITDAPDETSDVELTSRRPSADFTNGDRR